MTSAAGRIRTERVALTPLSVDDAPAMVDVLGDPALYAFTGGEPPTAEALTARYASQVAGSNGSDETWHNWIVRLQPDGVPVGYVQATVVGPTAEIAWVIGTHWQRQGLAREAVRAMAGWLRAQGTQRLIAHIHPEHVASERVAAAAGLAVTDEVDADGERLWAANVCVGQTGAPSPGIP